MRGHGLGYQGNYVWNDRNGSLCELTDTDGCHKPQFVAEFLGFDQKRNEFSGLDGLELKADNKRIRLVSNDQVATSPNLLDESSPLGLTLRKTPSLLNLIQTKLSQGVKAPPLEGVKNVDRELGKACPMKPMQDSGSQRANARYYDFAAQPMSEKLKASNFPALLLKIGTWERVSRYDGDLVAKCYYAKRKLVWEILDSGLKSKIEIQWSDISAIRAAFHENGPGILEVELSQPPLFFRETNPQPRKHTLWQATTDFTGGQAPLCRRHYLQFPEGTLERHYDKLLQCDNRLYVLSQRPFPSLSSPYFSSHGGYRGYLYDLSSCKLDDPGFEYAFKEGISPQIPHYDNMRSTLLPSCQLPRLDSLRMASSDLTSPCSVTEFPQESGARQRMEPPKSLFWEEALKNQQEVVIGNGDQMEGLPTIALPNQITPSLPRRVDDEEMLDSNNWAFQKMADDLLYDQADERRVMAEMNSMPFDLDDPLQFDIDNRYEQYYDQEGTISNSTFHQPVQDSNEYIPRHLPPMASYPYLLSDQAQEDFGCNQSNILWTERYDVESL